MMSLSKVELPSKIITEVKKTMTRKLVEFCGKDTRPMEIITGDGFKNLAQFFVEVGAMHGNIDVTKVLPHPTTVSRHINDVKTNVHEEIFPVIRNAMLNNECSATTDMWTDDFKKNSFISMTVHFIDDDFVLRKYLLFTSIFGDPKDTKKILQKTGENIKKEMITQFELLGYDQELLKKIKFVSDCGSNVILALKDYSRDDCRCHRLNTILQKTFDSDDVPLVVLQILKSTKKIVRYLKDSGKTNLLPKAVVQECETRWNTKLGVLQSVIQQYDEIKELLSIEQRQKWYINVELAEEIIQFLIPFKEATESLEGETYPTACKVLLWWSHLSERLNEANFNQRPVKILAQIAKTFFDLKFKVNMVNKIACFLDPRYRFLKMLSETDRNDVYIEIKRLLKESYQKDSHEHPSPAKKTRFSIFEETSNDLQGCDEFELYMQNANYSQYLNTEDNKKHLVELFWRNNKDRFPKLYLLAKKRLHVPASSAPSEIIFSAAGRTCNNRMNLKPKNLDDLLFLKNNLRFPNGHGQGMSSLYLICRTRIIYIKF